MTTLAVLDAGESLRHSPLRGRIIPEINQPSSREILYKSYRIMYDVVGEVVEITAIIHGARDFKP
jgi:toxin ParE1/3/4